jgi:hypothetical protein
MRTPLQLRTVCYPRLSTGTQRRKAEEKERQEKIRLGLMDAPAPKVKKANFMRVLGNDAVSDPTMVEQVVKAQMIMRQREHKEANAARQVTTEQRKERAVSKLTDGTELEIQVVVFRTTSMRNPSHKFKVGWTCRFAYHSPLHISSCAIHAHHHHHHRCCRCCSHILSLSLATGALVFSRPCCAPTTWPCLSYQTTWPCLS